MGGSRCQKQSYAKGGDMMESKDLVMLEEGVTDDWIGVAGEVSKWK